MAMTTTSRRFLPLAVASMALAATPNWVKAQTPPSEMPATMELPRWEFGLGVGGVTAPSYLGSNKQRTYVAPWPYLPYRGDHLRVNQDGINLGVLQSGSVRLDLSLGGALPVKSEGTTRQGMPDLAPLIELGAVVKAPLHTSRTSRSAIHLPLRYATGVNRQGLEPVGWIFDPTLRHLERFHIGSQPLEWGMDLTTKFQDARYNNHHYQVHTAYATPTRAAYTTRAGYAGTTINTGVLLRRGNMVFGTFIGYSMLGGARFADSPLIDQKHNWFGGLAVSWVLHQSKDTVQHPSIRD